MYAGQMYRRITIQRQTEVETEYGTQPGPWADVFSRIPAQVYEDLPSNNESVQGGLKMAVKSARVRIRYMPAGRVTSDMRVVVHNEADEVYQISGGPAEIGRREWTELTLRGYSS